MIANLTPKDVFSANAMKGFLDFVQKQGAENVEDFKIEPLEAFQRAADFVSKILYLKYLEAQGVNGKQPARKGLIFCGQWGSGKTTISAFIEKYLAIFKVKTPRIEARELLENYRLKNSRIDDRIGGNYSFPNNDFILDDLGIETESVYANGLRWGMKEFLLDRYEDFKKRNRFLIVTTNFNRAMIEARYGGAIGSRLKEMADWIILNDKDRRG